MIKRAGDLLPVIFVVVVFAIAACTQQRSPCYEPKIVTVALGTYKMVDTSSVDTSLPNPIVGCLDTNLQLQISAKNKFSLIFSPFQDSIRWYIQADSIRFVDSPIFIPEMIDTLTFYYDKQLTFISNACGYTYYY